MPKARKKKKVNTAVAILRRQTMAYRRFNERLKHLHGLMEKRISHLEVKLNRALKK